jgi:hypothetical protein
LANRFTRKSPERLFSPPPCQLELKADWEKVMVPAPPVFQYLTVSTERVSVSRAINGMIAKRKQVEVKIFFMGL